MTPEERSEKRYAAVFGLGLTALIGYRLMHPVPGLEMVLALLTAATAMIWILREHAMPLELHRVRDQRQQFDGRIAVITSLVTGLLLFLLVYLVAHLLMLAVYARQRSDILSMFLFELLQRLRLFESFHVIPFTGIFVIACTLMVAGVLLIYPWIPITHQWLAVTAAFLLSWAFLLSTVYLLIPVIHPLTGYSLLIDVVLVIIWATLFDHMYRKPLIPETLQNVLRTGRSGDRWETAEYFYTGRPLIEGIDGIRAS